MEIASVPTAQINVPLNVLSCCFACRPFREEKDITVKLDGSKLPPENN